MPNKVKHGTAHRINAANPVRPGDLSRWTSSAFQVQFGQVGILPTHIHDSAFHISAWGLSKSLCSLLDQYTSQEIAEAGRWLTTQQNNIVAMMLDQITFEAQMSGKHAPSIEDLFFSLETELFLPRGLRMEVMCVTNIVPDIESDEGLDKFVAVLDYTEVEPYIIERRGISLGEETVVH